jgi:hypothetical protein
MRLKRRNPKKTRPSRPPTYQEQTGSEGAFKNEIAALRRIFYDYTLVYDRAHTQQERDRAVEIISLLSNHMAQLARAQHLITPPEDLLWKALIEAGEAILRDNPSWTSSAPKTTALLAVDMTGLPSSCTAATWEPHPDITAYLSYLLSLRLQAVYQPGSKLSS